MSKQQIRNFSSSSTKMKESNFDVYFISPTTYKKIALFDYCLTGIKNGPVTVVHGS